jgi:hypothetical protein
MIGLFFLIQLAFVYGFYRVNLQLTNHSRRINTLENKSKAIVQAPQPKPQPKQIWEKEIEGFNPKKPETLRPNQVVGREVDDRRFEFDVKLK